MSFAAMWAYDLDNVVLNTAERGELVRFEQPNMAAASLNLPAVWGPVELADLGQGFIADTCQVWAAVSDFVAAGETVVPRRSRGAASRSAFVRYPSATPDSQERWEVEAVRRNGPTYEFDCVKNIRPVAS